MRAEDSHWEQGVCPCCTSADNSASWLGYTEYNKQTFEYLRCNSCGSLFCDPMPGYDTVSKMYGAAYMVQDSPSYIADSRLPDRVAHWMSTRSGGTFVDYGCGNGALLKTLMPSDEWEFVGVEYNMETAAKAATVLGIPVYSYQNITATNTPIADVLHLGDVVEHLTNPDLEMGNILKLIKPGGLLLSQGPLENHINLFTLILRSIRLLKSRRASLVPPYHVVLATAKGQQEYFRRFNLTSHEFTIVETSWPAPHRLNLEVVGSPRLLAMYILRKISRMLSLTLLPAWGNRYFYAGQIPHS